MQNRKVSFGAHTCSHAILSRLNLDGARDEVVRSVERVAQETGQMPIGFAYPNGLPGDYPDPVVDAVGETGIALGFTLSPGPARRREYYGDPLRIPRVYVHHADDLVSFGAKLAGIPRFIR
jgi:peptidoglycan/xylan/chitin deacetylase (PgdA/CDA1 family)